MITLIILFYLIVGICTGARRGLTLQLVYIAGYFITFLVALFTHEKLAKFLSVFIPYPSYVPGNQLAIFSEEQAMNLDHSFYRLISFLVIMILGWLVVRFLGYIASELTFLPLLKQFNTISGAALGFLMNYLFIYFVLYAIAMIPLAPAQKMIEGGLPNFIITKTPIVTQIVSSWLLPK